MRRAVRRHLGDDTCLDDLSFQGLTDPLIVRHALARAGVAVEPGVLRAILATYVDALAEELARAEGYRILPGVTTVLRALEGRADTAVGLGTGNLRAGARLKLERGGLERYFAFGGFGCDAEERAALLRVGAGRGADRLGRELGDCRTVVIGDTPRDVAAAAAIGADCVAVCTSGCSPDVLQAAGPCTIFRTLDASGVLDVLVG